MKLYFLHQTFPNYMETTWTYSLICLFVIKQLKSASGYLSFFLSKEAITGKMEIVNADMLVRSN